MSGKRELVSGGRLAQIKRLLAEGLNSTTIAERIGWGRGSVTNFCRAHGLKLPGKPRGRNGGRKRQRALWGPEYPTTRKPPV